MHLPVVVCATITWVCWRFVDSFFDTKEDEFLEHASENINYTAVHVGFVLLSGAVNFIVMLFWISVFSVLGFPIE